MESSQRITFLLANKNTITYNDIMQKLDVLQEEVWNIKRIILAFVGGITLLGGGGLVLKTFVIDQYLEKKQDQSVRSNQPQSVLGTESNIEPQDEVSPSLPKQIPSQEELKEKLEGIKNQVGKLTLEDIASSSPQLQKVVNDLKTLQEYPQNQLRDACVKVCSSL